MKSAEFCCVGKSSLCKILFISLMAVICSYTSLQATERLYKDRSNRFQIYMNLSSEKLYLILPGNPYTVVDLAPRNRASWEKSPPRGSVTFSGNGVFAFLPSQRHEATLRLSESDFPIVLEDRSDQLKLAGAEYTLANTTTRSIDELRKLLTPKNFKQLMTNTGTILSGAYFNKDLHILVLRLQTKELALPHPFILYNHEISVLPFDAYDFGVTTRALKWQHKDSFDTIHQFEIDGFRVINLKSKIRSRLMNTRYTGKILTTSELNELASKKCPGLFAMIGHLSSGGKGLEPI